MRIFRFWFAFLLVAAGASLAQQGGAVKAPSKGAPEASAPSKAEQPKFKAIWEPVNVKEDVKLVSVHFVTPEEGWVAVDRAWPGY